MSCGLHSASSHQRHFGTFTLSEIRSDAAFCVMLYWNVLLVALSIHLSWYDFFQVAERVAAERGESVGNGNSCGYQIRLQRYESVCCVA